MALKESLPAGGRSPEGEDFSRQVATITEGVTDKRSALAALMALNSAFDEAGLGTDEAETAGIAFTDYGLSDLGASTEGTPETGTRKPSGPYARVIKLDDHRPQPPQSNVAFG